MFAWIMSNLLGAIIGFVCGMLFSQTTYFASMPIKFSTGSGLVYDYHVTAIVRALLFWLPLGLGLGIAQWFRLRNWKIQTNGWIFATTLGWGLLGTGIAVAYDFFLRQGNPPRRHILATEAIPVLIGGMCLGILQSLAVRKSLLKPGLWILTNTLGVFGLLAFTLSAVALPFALKSYILNFFYALDLYLLVEARDLLLLAFLIIALPFITTITLFIPTGKILLKYIKTG